MASRVGLFLFATALLAGCATSGDVEDNADAVTTPAGQDVSSEDSTTTTLATEPAIDATTASIAPTIAELPATLELGRGINFGNSLEAPREGDWGAGLDESYFRIVAEAGFEHIRLPVSWAAYADTEPPYTIPDGVDPTIVGQPYTNIWERVDWAIDQAEANGLRIIVNFHHYEEAQVDPAAHRDRIIAMWQQIAPRYADAGNHVVFELFNEPHGEFIQDTQIWNDLLIDLLRIVRETNPTRPVMIGPSGYNHIDYLDELVLPEDENLIVTVHIYDPQNFTHQGAEWLDDVPTVGVPWSPDGLGLAEGVYDRSWDTRVITEDEKLRVDFGRQWAGFSVDYLEPVGPTELRFVVEGAGSLRIGCREPDSDELDEARITTAAEQQEFSIDLTGCPRNSTGISVMNQSADLNPIWFSSFEICSDANGCESILTSADESLRRWVRQASEWSEAVGIPVHIGEFGAYSAEGQVPMADRAAWTRAVVDEANTQGLSFAYWEFHAGYAAYDLDLDQWNDPLLDALLG